MIGALSIQLNYPLAFLAGLVSFLSPCVFPLLPVYLGYLGARVSTDQSALEAGEHIPARPRTFAVVNSVGFVVGFSVVFMLFFYVFSALNVSVLEHYRLAVDVVAGSIVILLALQVLGVLQLGFLMRDTRSVMAPGRAGALPSFVLGLTFAAGWTPCVGPQLTAILSLAALHEFNGLPAMILYCAGLGLPFVLVAALTGHLERFLRRLNQHLRIINLTGGALLLLFGLLLVSGNLAWLSQLGTSSPVKL